MQADEISLELANKPYSQACENNKVAIADEMEAYLRKLQGVLEIGSGTGQHAVYFGERFPALCWQTSDLAANHAGINRWLADYPGKNVLPPIELDIKANAWQIGPVEAIYSSNVIHIIEQRLVQRLFEHFVDVLDSNGLLFMYGPFNYGGRFTSEGNKRLDDWLKSMNAEFGIRDFAEIDEIARASGMTLLDDCTMPANNRLLIWRRLG